MSHITNGLTKCSQLYKFPKGKKPDHVVYIALYSLKTIICNLHTHKKKPLR